MFSRTKPNPDAELSLHDYMSHLQKVPIFVQYKALVGGPIAQAHAAVLFDCSVRSKDGEGFWKYDGDFKTNSGPVQGETPIKFRPQAKKTFLEVVVEESFRLDYKKIVSRQPYMAQLRNDALRGSLKTQLQAHAQPEATYWVDHRRLDLGKLARSLVGPGKEARAQENLKKAKAWVSYDMSGNAATTADSITQSQQLIDTHARHDGSWPLSFKKLADISAELVKGAPPYRKPSGEGETYPSNFGGTHLLMEAMRQMADTRLPPRGDARWANWALYAFAAIMAAQAFTDGNKRVARVAYATVMASGGIDFRAPNSKLGAQLANMRAKPNA
jgi:hypothetical protein